MSDSDFSTPDALASVRGDLVETIAHILGLTETLQRQAAELSQETFLPDLQKIQGAARQLTELIHEIVDAAGDQIADVDFPRLRFEVRTCLNHTVGYIEMLQERAHDLDQRGFLPALEKLHGGCRQLLVRTIATAPSSSPSTDVLATGEGMEGLLSQVEASEQAPPAEETVGMPGKLLVVDDSIQNRELLGRQLRSQGYRVVSAGSGPSAMERIRAEKFDLVLLDVVMPGMSGYEVLQWLKADAELREIPVLMISAMNDTENVVRCIVIGADDYITKPFDPVLLKVRIGSCLERSGWRRLEQSYIRQIEVERARSERLLLNMLPMSTVSPNSAPPGA